MIAKKTAQIRNREGLHFRSWGLLTAEASRFDSDIRVTRWGVVVNGKEMSALAAIVKAGDYRGGVLELEATGSDAEAAVMALYALIEDGFGEL